MDTQLQWIQQHVAWIFAAISLAVAIPGLAVAVMNCRKSRKAFSYRIMVDTPLLGPGNLGVHKDQHLTINGKDVYDVRVIVVELRNIGGKELDAKDFHDPIAIVFPKGSKLVDLRFVKAAEGYSPKFTFKYPEDGTETTPDGIYSIEFVNDLMNQGDFVRLSIMASMPPDTEIKVTGKIAGTKLTKGSPWARRARSAWR